MKSKDLNVDHSRNPYNKNNSIMAGYWESYWNLSKLKCCWTLTVREMHSKVAYVFEPDLNPSRRTFWQGERQIPSARFPPSTSAWTRAAVKRPKEFSERSGSTRRWGRTLCDWLPTWYHPSPKSGPDWRTEKQKGYSHFFAIVNLKEKKVFMSPQIIFEINTLLKSNLGAAITKCLSWGTS